VVFGATISAVSVAFVIGDEVFPAVPKYHWYVRPVPVAATRSVVCPPGLIVADCGWDVIAGSVQLLLTVTVAVVLLADPQLLLTRTQYGVVVLGATMSAVSVAFAIGEEVFADVPKYH
jgi:hypothetical protein